jgi:4-diphosphocytidyl-2-C-methyl-D-erythritol kinase
MVANEIQAAAKINLFLLVGDRGPEGYHRICSLMDRVSLCDILRIGRREKGLAVRGMDIPNLVSKAVMVLERLSGRHLPADIEIEKRIPLAAGLAGGSSDAAATMTELARLYGLELIPRDLEGPALEVGADIPFFLRSGPQLATGAGEMLEPVAGLPSYHAVVVVPEASLSTRFVYRLFDEMGGPRDFEQRAARRREALMAELDLPALASLMVNDLEPAAMSQVPAIADIKKELVALGAAGALMSGSGPSVFGIFARKAQAHAAAAMLGEGHRSVWQAGPLH